MNVGGHIAVAAALDLHGDDGGYLLGAALPDLSTMGGFRLLGSTTDALVAEGIRLHHRSDDAFHQHPWFTERNRSLRAELSAAGVPRGAARACSHVGIELLLDGELLDDDIISGATSRAFDAIAPRLDALDPLVGVSEIASWRRHLALLDERRLPTDYADPEAVARRLYRILQRRPRLALPLEVVPVVVEVLAKAQPSIAATAHSLINAIETELADSLG